LLKVIEEREREKERGRKHLSGGRKYRRNHFDPAVEPRAINDLRGRRFRIRAVNASSDKKGERGKKREKRESEGS